MINNPDNPYNLPEDELVDEDASPAGSAPTLSPEDKVYTCQHCGVQQVNEPLKTRHYCDNCFDHLAEAYKWLQSPMLSKNEQAKIRQKIIDLTDIQNINFE